MADSTLDDVYDDPDNILADDDDDVSGAVELPDEEKDEPSQSIFVPEKDTTDLDDRGPIDELELTDAKDSDIDDDIIDPALFDDSPSSFDGDSYQQNDEQSKDEQDGTEE